MILVQACPELDLRWPMVLWLLITDYLPKQLSVSDLSAAEFND